jgi:hypothetical protein
MEVAMIRIQHLFLLAICLMPVHIAEQLLFGIDELYELQAATRACLSLFDDPERGTVVIVGVVTTVVLFFCYGFMAGGVPRFIATMFFGLEFMFEGHHIVKTVVRGAYFPGAVTALALVVVGAMIATTAWREFRRTGFRVLEPSKVTFSGA